MAGEYTSPWAQALDKLSNEDLTRLANQFQAEKDLEAKNQLMLDRVKIDGDIKHLLSFGGDYDAIINQIGTHQKLTNDSAWSMQQINKVQSAKSAEIGLNDAVSNLNRLSSEIRGLSPLDGSSGDAVSSIMGDVQTYLGNLNKMKKHNLAISHQKTIKEDVEMFKALRSMQVWDTDPSTPKIDIAGDDPARQAKNRAILASQMNNLTEVKKSILDVPGQEESDPQSFTIGPDRWDKAPAGYQDTDKGKADQVAGTLRERDEGSGKWYHVYDAETGTSEEQKLTKEQNLGHDKAIRSMVADVQSAHDLEELSDEFKADAVGHPKRPYVGGDFVNDDSRRRLKKNLASTIHMWFSGKTAEGKDTSHDMDAAWVEKILRKHSKKSKEDQIKFVMSDPRWAKVVGEGNVGLEDLIDWKGTGSGEEAANQYFLKTMELYKYLDSVTGKKGGDLISKIMGDDALTVEDEKELQEFMKLFK